MMFCGGRVLQKCNDLSSLRDKPITQSLSEVSIRKNKSPQAQQSLRPCQSPDHRLSNSPEQGKSRTVLLPADEEPVDPKKYLEESCKPKCVKPLLEYQACVKRIQDDETGHKHCTGQYFDYWSCVDKCVALKLFSKLK
ncbi:cytochrome b-c1 complex [Salix suchowensis]|nr:cytochrome b-c1 complex [Salix suchowensis]